MRARSRSLPPRATSCRGKSSIGACSQSSKSTYTDALPTYIHPETGRVHTSYALAATTTGRLSSLEPNLQNIPVRTSEGRAIRKAFVLRQGQAADLGRLQPDRASRARPYGRHADAASGLRRRARYSRHDRKRDVRRADRGHGPGYPPPRQGDQFRHRLRHLRRWARRPARHPAGRGRPPTSTPISSASPAYATTWRRPRPRRGDRAM